MKKHNVKFKNQGQCTFSYIHQIINILLLRITFNNPQLGPFAIHFHSACSNHEILINFVFKSRSTIDTDLDEILDYDTEYEKNRSFAGIHQC